MIVAPLSPDLPAPLSRVYPPSGFLLFAEVECKAFESAFANLSPHEQLTTHLCRSRPCRSRRQDSATKKGRGLPRKSEPRNKSKTHSALPNFATLSMTLAGAAEPQRIGPAVEVL